jgi:hypothetical protein
MTPSGTIVQVPRDVGKPHDIQVPLQAPSQQYPSTQKLLLHSDAHEQASPLSLLGPTPPSLLVQMTGTSTPESVPPSTPGCAPVPPAPEASLLGDEVEQPTTNRPTRAIATANRFITWLPHSSIEHPALKLVKDVN